MGSVVNGENGVRVQILDKKIAVPRTEFRPYPLPNIPPPKPKPHIRFLHSCLPYFSFPQVPTSIPASGKWGKWGNGEMGKWGQGEMGSGCKFLTKRSPSQGLNSDHTPCPTFLRQNQSPTSAYCIPAFLIFSSPQIPFNPSISISPAAQKLRPLPHAEDPSGSCIPAFLIFIPAYSNFSLTISVPSAVKNNHPIHDHHPHSNPVLRTLSFFSHSGLLIRHSTKNPACLTANGVLKTNFSRFAAYLISCAQKMCQSSRLFRSTAPGFTLPSSATPSASRIVFRVPSSWM